MAARQMLGGWPKLPIGDKAFDKKFDIVKRIKVAELTPDDVSHICGFRTGKNEDEVNGYGSRHVTTEMAYSYEARKWVDVTYCMEHPKEKVKVASDQARTPYVYPLAGNIIADVSKDIWKQRWGIQ